MCKKLNEIYGKSPNDFLKNNLSFPIDIYKILEDHNIECIETDFSKLQEDLPLKNAHIDGMAYAHKDDLYIFYSNNPKSKLPSTRFTLAHELGHCCLHMGKETSYHIEMKIESDVIDKQGRRLKFFDQRKENEADRFARDLLIPTDVLLFLLANVDTPSINQLADAFCVPVSEMEKKIKEIRGLINKND